MAGVITASEPSWIAPFTGLSPRDFRKLITRLRREGAERTRPVRPWPLPLEDRVLLVAAYWRTNLTLRQLAPLFGISTSSADRIIDHTAPQLALKQRQRFRRDTVLIVDGTLVPTRDHTIAEQSKNYRYSTNHQVVIDADPRLVVAVGRPVPGNCNDCKAWRNPAPKPPSPEHSRSPTAAIPAPGSSCPTAGARAKTFRTGRKHTTSPVEWPHGQDAPTVLAAHPDRRLAALGERHVVDHPHLGPDNLGQQLGDPLSDRQRIPRRLVHELLQGLHVPVRQTLGHRLDRLTPGHPASAPADSTRPWTADPYAAPRRTHPPRTTPTRPVIGSLHACPRTQHALDRRKRRDLTKHY